MDEPRMDERRMKAVGVLAAAALALQLWWWQTSPPRELEIADPVMLAPMAPDLARVETSGDDLAAGAVQEKHRRHVSQGG